MTTHPTPCLSIPCDRLAIDCSDTFADGLPDELDGWDLIEATATEARRPAYNELAIRPDNVMRAILGALDTDPVRPR